MFMFMDELMHYMKKENIGVEVKQLEKWFTENDYDNDAIKDDIFDYTYESLSQQQNQNIKNQQSNIAQNLTDKTTFDLILHYNNIRYFNSLFINENCELINNGNVGVRKCIEDLSTEEVINLMSENILIELNCKILNENKKYIFDFFEDNKINGKKLKLMKRKQFVEMIIKHSKNLFNLTMMEIPLTKLYKIFTDMEDKVINDITHCSVIHRISFISFKHNQNNDA
eukprot:224449_1